MTRVPPLQEYHRAAGKGGYDQYGTCIGNAE